MSGPKNEPVVSAGVLKVLKNRVRFSPAISAGRKVQGSHDCDLLWREVSSRDLPHQRLPSSRANASLVKRTAMPERRDTNS